MIRYTPIVSPFTSMTRLLRTDCPLLFFRFPFAFISHDPFFFPFLGTHYLGRHHRFLLWPLIPPPAWGFGRDRVPHSPNSIIRAKTVAFITIDFPIFAGPHSSSACWTLDFSLRLTILFTTCFNKEFSCFSLAGGVYALPRPTSLFIFDRSSITGERP